MEFTYVYEATSEWQRVTEVKRQCMGDLNNHTLGGCDRLLTQNKNIMFVCL